MSAGTSTSRPRLRLLLAALGGFVMLIGLLALASPLAAARSRKLLVRLLGNDYFVVAIFGAIALLVVAAVAVARGKTGLDQTSPPAPEGVYPVARFGQEIDEFLEDAGLGAVRGTDRHEAVRSRLRDIAITTIMRETNATQAEARERIDTGTWTDNDVAAAFLSASETPDLGARLKAALKGTSPYRESARVTATEIGRIDEEAGR